jgi:hypothetical protein
MRMTLLLVSRTFQFIDLVFSDSKQSHKPSLFVRLTYVQVQIPVRYLPQRNLPSCGPSFVLAQRAQRTRLPRQHIGTMVDDSSCQGHAWFDLLSCVELLSHSCIMSLFQPDKSGILVS